MLCNYNFNFYNNIHSICSNFFYQLLICQPHKRIIIVNKKKKTLTKGNKGVLHCCACCFFDQRIYDLNEVKNITIRLTSQDDPIKGFGKIYFIECYIYSNMMIVNV